MIVGLKNLLSSNRASKSAHTERNRQKDKSALCPNAELQTLLHYSLVVIDVCGN